MTEARVRVRFRGLFGVVVPRSKADPAHLLLVDARQGIRPLGLESEPPVPRHVGLIEFRGPAVVNDVHLLGGGYFPLAGHEVTVLPGADNSSGAPRVSPRVHTSSNGVALPGAVNMSAVLGKKLGRLDARLLTDAQPHGLVGRVTLHGGTLKGGHPSRSRWQVPSSLSPKEVSVANLAHELWLEMDESTEGLSFELRHWVRGETTVFTVRPLADQDVDVIVSNVCGILPSTCTEEHGQTDEDFRALYELLEPEAKSAVREAITSQKLGRLPVPQVFEEAYVGLPCYYARFADPR